MTERESCDGEDERANRKRTTRKIKDPKKRKKEARTMRAGEVLLKTRDECNHRGGEEEGY